MITILNGKLTIPESERFIGFAGDNLRRTIEFLVSGAKEADRIYRLYLTFDDGTVNYFVLPSQVTDKGVVLTWQVLREHIFMSGWVKAQIKAFSGNGVVYHTSTDRFFVGDSAEFSDSIKKQNTEFLRYEERLNELSKELSEICVLMPFVGDNGNWYIYDAEKGEYVDSGKPSVYKTDSLQITDGAVTSMKLADCAIDRLSLFSMDMIAKYLAMPVIVHGILGEVPKDFYNTLTTQGIHRIDDHKGTHQVVVVLKPSSEAHLMQLKFDYNKIEYRGIWCTDDGIYADDDWEDWTLLTLQVDSELNPDSDNPVQNKAVHSALDRKMNKASNFDKVTAFSDSADPELIAYQTYDKTAQEMFRIPISVISERIRKITDAGEFYVSETVDGALQEVGKILKALNACVETDVVNLIEGNTPLIELSNSCSNLLSNINDNRIIHCNINHGWLDAPTTEGGIFINLRYSTNYNIQIMIVIGTGRVHTRIVDRRDFSVFRAWCSDSESFFKYLGEYTTKSGADSVDNKLVNILDVGSCGIANGHYTDVPSDYPTSGTGTLINVQTTGNYGMQYLTHYASGLTWSRLVNRTNKTVSRDWSRLGVDARMKVLAIGDSICRGVRNEEKGFVGDLGLPYKNIGVSGATISNEVTTYMNIPDQLINLNTTEPDYVPDVIIAEGGINDWAQGAPLGDVPTIPVNTYEQADALDRSTVLGGLQYLFYKMVALYPKAQRFFLITHKSYKVSGSAYCPAQKSAAGWTQQDLHDAIVECCKVYNVKVIDIYEESMLNTVFDVYRSSVAYNTDNSVTDTEYCDSDGVHPLAYGYKECYVPLVKKALGIGTVK